MARSENRARMHRRARPRGRVWQRLLAGFVASVLIGVAAAAGFIYWGAAQIDRSLVTGLVSARAAAADTDPEAGGEEAAQPRLLNVLVVGNDSREGLTREQIREFGTGQAEGNRTDTIMLLQLEVDGKGRGAMLSFPRDLLVTRCDGSQGRINAAYGVGLARDGDGPSCLVETVSDLTGVSINHYLEVSFAGFVNVVDALGGVGLYLDKPLYDEKAHLDLPAGCVKLEGAEALGFVRARYVDNDFGRIARQQRFVKETVREATSLGVLANPPRLLRIIDAAASSVRTDEALGVPQMREIAMGMRRLTAQGLAVHTVPSEPRVINGTAYVQADRDAAKTLYQAFRDSSVLRTPPSAPSAAKAPPTPVRILNASGQDGLAAAAATYLRSEGFTIADATNDSRSDLQTSRILYGPELQTEAQDLIKLFPQADVVEGVEGLPLTLKLGSDVQADTLLSKVEKESPTPEPGLEGLGYVAPGDAESPEYSGGTMTDVDC